LAEVHGQVRLVFGLGFAVDGFSFFVEAIFISIYVYGWDRFSARVHFASGIPIITAGFTGSLTADLRQRLDEPPQLRFARSSRVSEQRPDRGDVNGFAVLKAKPGAAFRRAFWKRSRSSAGSPDGSRSARETEAGPIVQVGKGWARQRPQTAEEPNAARLIEGAD